MPLHESQSFGDALHMTMAAKRVGVRGVAKDCGMSHATVSRICNGYSFELRWIIPLAKWMGLTEKELWQLLEAEARK